MIEATNKNYVIEALGQTKETAGGIFLHSTDETELAQVVSIGPDIEKNPIPVGSRVAINWGAAIQIKVGNKKCFIIHADHILGVVKDES